MRFTDIFIKRPVLAICINLILLITGIISVYKLNTREYPRSDLAKITIETAYIGASPDLVQGFITTPLERVIASADGIDYLESSSKQGLSTITANLVLNYDTSSALTQIQSKVAEVRNELPPEAESPIIKVESTDNQFASLYIGSYSEKMESNQITDYLIRVVQPQFSSVLGVQKADILGARTFAMRIWLDTKKMASINVSAKDVQDALRKNNYLSAIGNTKGSLVKVDLIANTDLKNEQEFKDLVVKNINGTLIRLSDVSEVELGAENYDSDVRFSGQSARFMGIWVLPDANSLDVIKRIRQLLPSIKKNLPSDLSFEVPYDSTKYIEDAIKEVVTTLVETILIVILVIYVFIGSFKSVLIPVVAIPLSLLGGCIFMLLFGFSLNLLTLLAIVLAVGLVVDDAIVMLENIERHIQDGENPISAAVKGSRELVLPIIAVTITLVTVYAPIGIQGGLTGALFKEFAFTLAGAVFVSGFVALTLSPMMSSFLIKKEHKKNKFQLKTDEIFSKLLVKYEKGLKEIMDHRKSVFIASIMCMFFAFPLYIFSAKELAPKEDKGVVFGIVQASPNSTLEQTSLFTQEILKVFQSFKEFAMSFQITNPSGGFSGMRLKTWGERKRTSMEISQEAWGKVASVPGVRVIIATPPALPGGSSFPVEIVIKSTDDPLKLYEYGNQLVQSAFQSGMFMFADSDLKYDLPQAEININRDKIALMGLDLQQIGNELGVYLGGNYTNRFNIQGRSYKVIPQTKRLDRLTAEDLNNIYVTGPNNQLISLSTIATIKNKVIPRELKKFQQLNSITIQGAIPPGVSLDKALKAIETKAQEILPFGYQIDYKGESRQLRNEGSALVYTLFLSIILIYLVLESQFESFRDPFIILLGSVPLALFGSLIFSFLGFTTMNIYSQVALVTLVGLVTKNGILIVEFANKLQETGKDKLQAVIEASLTRFRPILMTSFATVLGHFPLILASGAGAGARNSIGIMLVTGMFIGTFFTLFVVPVIYTYFAKTRVHTLRDEI